MNTVRALLAAIASAVILASIATDLIIVSATAAPATNPTGGTVPAARPYVPYSTLQVMKPAQAAPAQPASTRCPRPAPTTAAGYQQLWASLPQSQWGGADVSISVPLPDGRIVWLYGDTLSTHGMVHQSAIVQDRGCLHVANAGAQLEPNLDAHTVQWIEDATADPQLNEIFIQFRVITITGHCAWCFKDAGWSYLWGFDVTKAGDLVKDSPLGGRLEQPPVPTSPLTAAGPHHYTYAQRLHPEITLADGNHLVTTCQNWDDGTLHPFADYRPIFSG